MIKPITLRDVVLNVKEIGGADTYRRYWSHYCRDANGLVCHRRRAVHRRAQIYVIDASGDVAAALQALMDVGAAEPIRHMPLLVLLNKADQPGAAPDVRIDAAFLGNRLHVLAAVSMQDPAGLAAAFNQFGAIYLAATRT